MNLKTIKESEFVDYMDQLGIDPIRYEQINEEFIDEDTGEIVTTIRDIPICSKSAKTLVFSRFKKVKEEINRISNKITPLKQEIIAVDNELSMVETDIAMTLEDIDQLRIDMEEELSSADESSEQYVWKEAQYGEKLNSLEEELESLKGTKRDLEKKLNRMESEYPNDLEFELDDLYFERRMIIRVLSKYKFEK